MKLKDRTSLFCFSWEKSLRYASYEYRKNKSTRRGAQLVQQKCRLSDEKHRQPNITNMVSIKSSSILMISVSEKCLVGSQCVYQIRFAPS